MGLEGYELASVPAECLEVGTIHTTNRPSHFPSHDSFNMKDCIL